MKRHAKAIVAISAMLLTFAFGISSAAALAPTVTIDPGPSASYLSADVSGDVDPKDVGTWWSFEYAVAGSGNWSGFGYQGFAEEDSGSQAVSQELTGLKPGTDYEVRLVARNDVDPDVISAVVSFKTPAMAKPTVAIKPVAAISGDSAELSGTVDPNGADPAFKSTCFFEYITDAAYQARDGKQRLTIKASGGTYTLELEGQVTAPIAFNATAATVKGALEALPNVTPGTIAVSGGPGNLAGSSPYILTFIGANRSIWADQTNLTGAGRAQVTTITPGFFGQNEVQQLTITASGGTYTLSFEGQSTAPVSYDASAEALRAALEALSSVGAGSVGVTGGPGNADGSTPYTLTFKGALGNANLKQIAVNAAALTGNGQADGQTIVQGHAEGFEGADQLPCQPSETVEGAGPHDVEADLSGLEPDTEYHVRLWAENPAGRSTADTTFKTLTPGPELAAGTVGALTHQSARLTALVDANNTDATVSFEYATDPGFSSPVLAPAGLGSEVTGNGVKIAFADIASGLQPDTTYYWRVSAENAAGSADVVAPRGFHTWPVPVPRGSGIGAFGDRTIELASTNDGNGNAPFPEGAISADGDRVAWGASGGTEDSSFGSFANRFFADRTPTGWKVTTVAPPRASVSKTNLAALAISADVTKVALAGRPNFGESGNDQLMRFDPRLGEMEVGAETNIGAARTAFSADLTRGIGLGSKLDPNDPAESALYDLTAPAPVLVSLMPGETVPACGVSLYGDWIGNVAALGPQNWVSPDGRGVVFHSSGNCTSPTNLYLRQAGPDGSMAAGHGTTTWISGPVVAGDDKGAQFAQLTDDGTQVFFASLSRLESGDGNETLDVYRHTLGVGNFCVTCSVPEADVDSPALGNNNNGSRILAARDGSRVYFTSRRVLAPGATPSALNVYVWHADDPNEIEYIYTLGASDVFDPTGWPEVIANDDASVLVFVARSERMDQLTGSANNGFSQYYRYDDESRAIVCISCPADGSGLSGLGARGLSRFGGRYGSELATTPMLSTDGRAFVFEAEAKLAPDDVNGAPDVYEWRQNQVGLISSGRGAQTGVNGPYPYGISANLKTILFASAEEELPGAGAYQEVYVARIDGGFTQAPPPVPCSGDGCQGAPSAPPTDSSAGTVGFQGPGNQGAKPTPRCAKGKVRKRGSCVKKSKKPAKKKAAKKRASANRGGSNR